MTFRVEKESQLQEVPADHSVELLWLDGRDLLDPRFFTNPLTFPGTSVKWANPRGLGRRVSRVIADRSRRWLNPPLGLKYVKK
jgi:hypothetical protein